MLQPDIRFYGRDKKGRPTKVTRALALFSALAHELRPELSARVRIDLRDLVTLRNDWVSVGVSLDWLEAKKKGQAKGEVTS